MNRRLFLKSIFGIGGCLSLYGLVDAYEKKKIGITRQHIRFKKKINPLRFIAVSDLHLPNVYAPPGKLVDMINDLNSDILALVGDTIDQRGNEKLAEIFKNIDSKIGKFAVLGNWEYQGGINAVEMRKVFSKSGIQFLLNDFIDFGNYIIIGLDDFLHGNPDYGLIEKVSAYKKPLIVLCHCPAAYDFMPQFDSTEMIVISGHTHGGQITPFGIVLSTPEGSGAYSRGWYHKKKSSMYVMRGIAATGIPLRIGASPEIFMADFE
jgi:predicted MPP superfamily phosphohydrolase